MTTEGATNLNRVPDLGNIMKEGGDLTVFKPFDDEFVDPLRPGGRRHRIASLCLIAIRCSEPDVEVLASPEGAPVLGSKQEALHPCRLGLNPFDHSLLPRNMRCSDGRVRHDQSPVKRCSRQGSP